MKVEAVSSPSTNPSNIISSWKLESNPWSSLPDSKEKAFLKFDPIWGNGSKRHYDSPKMSCIHIRHWLRPKTNWKFLWEFKVSLSIQAFDIRTSFTKRLFHIKVFIQEICIYGLALDVVETAEQEDDNHSCHPEIRASLKSQFLRIWFIPCIWILINFSLMSSAYPSTAQYFMLFKLKYQNKEHLYFCARELYINLIWGGQKYSSQFDIYPLLQAIP